jgi:molecular chaperone GrpE
MTHPKHSHSDGREPESEDPSRPQVAAGPEDLEQVQREREEFLAGWKRSQADYQNLRRRTQSDIEAAVRRSQQRVFEGLLLALDHLELALGSAPESGDAERLAQGVRMTRDQMLRLLEQEGVRPMASSPPGEERFDPSVHLAVRTVERDDLPPGSVVETARSGYSWGDLVLRPAQVVVNAAAGEAGAQRPGQEPEGAERKREAR